MSSYKLTAHQQHFPQVRTASGSQKWIAPHRTIWSCKRAYRLTTCLHTTYSHRPQPKPPQKFISHIIPKNLTKFDSSEWWTGKVIFHCHFYPRLSHEHHLKEKHVKSTPSSVYRDTSWSHIYHLNENNTPKNVRSWHRLQLGRLEVQKIFSITTNDARRIKLQPRIWLVGHNNP